MNVRFGVLAMMVVACTAGLPPSMKAEVPNRPIAKVLVWVRDGHGAPVSDLTAVDFEVVENGLPDRVVNVERFFSGTQIQSQNPALQASGTNPSQMAPPSASALTHILVLLAPMPAVGRSRAIADALRYFSGTPTESWDIALVDDEGNFTGYSRNVDRVRASLKELQGHYSPHAKFSKWHAGTQSAVRDLGVLPGRHVIILISSRDGVPASWMIAPAVSNQAAMYAIESQGAATVAPFGGAAGFQTIEAGPIPFFTGEFAAVELSSTLANMGYTDTGLGQFSYAAEETGGRSVDNVKDAFEHISADAAGYYLVSFEARAQENGGTVNAFSVTVKRPHLNVKGPRHYVIPRDGASRQMPADMKAALQAAKNPKDLRVVANSWLFPDQGGVHWGVFAADLNWLDGAPPTGSTVKIYAELTNESMHGLSATWNEEKVWPTETGMIHWQADGRVYPGSYTLRVTAMDTASGHIAAGIRTFTARPLDVPAFRFSGIVLADACLPPAEQTTGPKSLFDPILVDGCKLAPAAGAQFRSDESVRILHRIYPPNEKLSHLVQTQWKTYAMVDDALDKTTELKIAPAEVRGLNVSGMLSLKRLHLAPGKHYLTVVYVLPGNGSKVQKIPLRTEFLIAQ